jgi:hypothetical protein
MAIIRTPKTKEFFSVSNKLAQDARLSFEARGVMLYLLSKPADWIVQFSDIEREGKFGREKRQKIFAELETAGYFERLEKREEGKFKFDYIVHEKPINIGLQPRTGKPLTVKPATVEPLTVKPLHTKNREEQKTELHKEAQDSRNFETSQPVNIVTEKQISPYLAAALSTLEEKRMDSPFSMPDWYQTIAYAEKLNPDPKMFAACIDSIRRWATGRITPKMVSDQFGKFLTDLETNGEKQNGQFKSALEKRGESAINSFNTIEAIRQRVEARRGN